MRRERHDRYAGGNARVRSHPDRRNDGFRIGSGHDVLLFIAVSMLAERWRWRYQAGRKKVAAVNGDL